MDNAGVMPAIRQLVQKRIETLSYEIGYDRYSPEETDAMIQEREDLQNFLTLGPTGEHPEGKLNADDQGGLNAAIGRNEKGDVVINFGTQVAWIAMKPAEAATFALTVLGHAGAVIGVNVDDAMIERAKEYIRDLDFEATTNLYKNDENVRALLNVALHGSEATPK